MIVASHHERAFDRRPALGRRARLFASMALVAVTLVALASPTSGNAATPPPLNANSYAPGALPGDGALVPSIRPASDAPADGDAPLWSALSSLAYSRRSLAFSSDADGSHRVQVLHGDLATLDLGLGAGWRAFGFEVALPVALVVRGGGPDLLGIEPPMGPTFGDLRLAARWRGLTGVDIGLGRIDLGGRLQWSAPTAGAASWLGGGGAQFDLSALAGWSYDVWTVDLELGVRLRPLATFSVIERDPSTGQPRLDAAGDPQNLDVLASGTRAFAKLRAARSLPWRSVSVALEGQGWWDVAADATSGQWLGDGLLVAELPLQRGAWRILGAVGGAATSSWGSASTRALIGLRFRPDRLPADSDGDGRDDRDDRCPNAAEDDDGFEDGDGCPDLDDDGDGVPDTADRCRLEPEDKDGFEDADGCPEPDDDGDGIPDAQDRCPRPAAGAPAGSSAEDIDGFEDGDGCPEADNDGDGIADVDDLCPDAPETINGYADVDGCPDQPPPALVSLIEGRILLRQPLRFVPGGAQLDASSRPILAAVAALLREHPEVKALEVAAYTDDAGTPAERLTQTQARAEAVKQALVGSSGLAAHQIVAKGFGDAQPLASNDGAWGRTRNRRIELRVLGPAR